LQELSLESFGSREHAHTFARHWICNFLLVLEITPMFFDFGDTADSPPHGQINFLVFPVFREDDAPHRAYYRIHGGEMTKKGPGRGTSDGREEEEGEVGLSKSKVKGNLYVTLATT